jgi:predicted MFS family arabinose efflux permease
VLIWALYSSTLLLMRSTIWNRAATSCFSASRGLALALMIGGIPLAQIAGPILAQWLIADHGWRSAYLGIGLGWGGITLLVAVLWFREPRDRMKATGGSTQAHAPPPQDGQTFGAAIRDPRILRITLAALLQSLIGGGLNVHLFPMLTGQGLTRDTGAGVLAVMGVAALAGQLVSGFLSDRVKSTLLPMSAFFIPAITFVLLLFASGSLPLLILAVACAGFGMAACVMLVTYLASRYGGVANFGKIHGIISACLGFGGGIGPFLAGTIFDQTGSYAPFLIGGAIVALFNVALVCRLGPYPDFSTQMEKPA